MIRAVFAVAIFAALCSQSAAGIFVNGNDLLGWCQNDTLSSDMYILGAVDMNSAIFGTTGGKEDCEPPNVIAKQVIDVVCTYLRDHPSNRQAAAPMLIAVALKEAWPCH